MATKREIDGLVSDIPAQVAAAHSSVRSVNEKKGGDVAGPFAGNPIDPSDYGFDMFGCDGATYIRERSKEIARQTLKVHGLQPAEGKDNSGVADGSDFGKAEKQDSFAENTPLSEKNYSGGKIPGQKES